MNEEKKECDYRSHQYRLVNCENDRDTYRCEKCGKEFSERCTFDEDFS